MIQFDIEGRKVLDLFAGSGQMALEALSRGAASAVMVDRAKEAIAIINENARKTKLSEQCTIYQADYLDFLKRNSNNSFDIVFLDPPYALKMYKPAMEALLNNGMIKPTSLIICESGEESVFEGDEALASRFVIERQTKYSKTFITVFKPDIGEKNNEQ